jgi:hypothetical protein
MTTIKKLKTTDTEGKGKFASLMAINTLLGVSSILLLLLTTANTIRIANKPAPSLVQLRSGEAVTVQAADSNHREDAVIQSFVSNSLVGMFTFDGTIPPTTPEEALKPTPDPGIEISNPKTRKTRKIATSTYLSSFALAGDRREEFLYNMVELTPQTAFTGENQVAFVANHISKPIKVKGEKGKWQVDVVGVLYTFQGGTKLNKAIPFNKRVTVEAVMPPKYDKEFETPMAAKIAQYRQAGLQITQIIELQDKNLK